MDPLASFKPLKNVLMLRLKNSEETGELLLMLLLVKQLSSEEQ